MYLYCPNCNRFYAMEYLADGRRKAWCPDITCKHELVEMDENMIAPIKVLNEKGYRTSFCCSGHVDRDYFGGYIAFHPSVVPYLPDSTPAGWEWDEKPTTVSGVWGLRYKFDKDDSIEKRALKMHFRLHALVEWCMKLDTINTSL